MDSHQKIYDTIKATYAKTYIGIIDQGEDITAVGPIILIESVSLTPTDNKDNAMMDGEGFRISVMSSNYATAKAASEAIRTTLEALTDNCIRDIEFEGRQQLREDMAEVFRFVNDFKINQKCITY